MRKIFQALFWLGYLWAAAYSHGSDGNENGLLLLWAAVVAFLIANPKLLETRRWVWSVCWITAALLMFRQLERIEYAILFIVGAMSALHLRTRPAKPFATVMAAVGVVVLIGLSLSLTAIRDYLESNSLSASKLKSKYNQAAVKNPDTRPVYAMTPAEQDAFFAN
ncbi:MAG: hypothetical protein K2Z81_04440, partial [Cyanobacteria bacterium]|nr:hypothetical protein [Cyanobacteriota bacterium]